MKVSKFFIPLIIAVSVMIGAATAAPFGNSPVQNGTLLDNPIVEALAFLAEPLSLFLPKKTKIICDLKDFGPFHLIYGTYNIENAGKQLSCVVVGFPLVQPLFNNCMDRAKVKLGQSNLSTANTCLENLESYQ